MAKKRATSQKSKTSASVRKQFLALRRAIVQLAEMSPRTRPSFALPEQPFDALLMKRSSLYRRSRETYLKTGGKFESRLVSSPRTLSSPTLLDPCIQFSPIETEMIWAATDPIERNNAQHLMTLRTYVGSMFHEQSHRILWTLLPPAPQNRAGIRRYLNFAESLVIATDMALGDALGSELAPLLYQTGSVYDPGTDILSRRPSRRQYRTYLQAAVHATYLNLELYDPQDVASGISALFPGLGDLAERAARRSANLDRAFVWKTNPSWQKKQGDQVMKALSGRRPLELSDDPMDHRQQYLLAEQWFETMGL